MILLITGIVMLVGMHLVPSMPGLRSALVNRLGNAGYQGVFALVAIGGIVLMVLGRKQVPYQQLWATPAWGKHAAMGLVLLAFILIVAANAKTNIKRFTRHPMSWGIVLWAAAHLINRGDLGWVIFFGAFAGFSLLMMLVANMKGAAKQTEKISPGRELVPVVAGLVIYIIFVLLHPVLFGVKLY